MSALVDRAIAASGLGELADARRAGDHGRVAALASRLEGADLLVLGALADRIRAEEVGARVAIFAGAMRDGGDEVLVVGVDENVPGQGRGDVLRRVAAHRITGPRAARVRVDWETCGIELSQVALGFGANELAGPVLNRRGLPILEGATQKVKGAGQVSSQLLKKKELAVLVRMAGREPVFADLPPSPADDDDAPEPTHEGDHHEHA